MLWLGGKAAGWEPFTLPGIQQYDVNDRYNLAHRRDDRSTQPLFELGIVKRLSDKTDLREYVRLLSGRDEDGEDVGFKISLNQFFGNPAQAAVVMQSAAIIGPEAQLKSEPKMPTVVMRLSKGFA